MLEKKIKWDGGRKIVAKYVNSTSSAVIRELKSKNINPAMIAVVNKIVSNIDDVDTRAMCGTAVCDGLDEFNGKAGQDLAGSKLDAKYHAAMAKKYASILDTLIKITEMVSDLEDYHRNKAVRIHVNINKEFFDGDEDDFQNRMANILKGVV